VIPTAIGLGLVMSLVFTEAFGLGTLLAAAATLLTIRLIGRFMLLYGRRLLVMVILVGFLYGHLTRIATLGPGFPEVVSFSAIGYVVPGLIAYWMERQGALETLMSMFMAAVLVRLVLIVVTGGVPIEVPAW
jgi:hypothetical protein